MFEKLKEKQSLINASRTALEKAEIKVQERNVLIADMEKQAKVLYEEKKELEKEISVKDDLITRIINLANANKYNNENIILNKIKELISDFDNQN